MNVIIDIYFKGFEDVFIFNKNKNEDFRLCKNILILQAIRSNKKMAEAYVLLRFPQMLSSFL